MRDLPDIDLTFNFDSKRQTLLKSRGVDGSCFATSRNKFNFCEAVVRMKPEIKNVVNKGISVKRQISTFSKILDHPLRGAPVIGIGSFPSDNRAKLLALNLMNRAIDLQTAKNDGPSRSSTKNYPRWHRVYGGLGDSLRDKDDWDNPSMLIISNVGADSTPIKIEKVRDILVKFDTVPRIVVVNGCDPMKFFASKLFYPMNYGYYIGSDSKTAILEF